MLPVRLIPSRVLEIDLPPFDPLNLRAAQLRAEGHHVISLGQALPFFTPPSSAIEAARAALDTPEVHRYSTDPGLPSLRTVLAERLSETVGGSISGGDLVITAGANHAFTLAMATLVDPGDEVVLPSPYFTNHHMVISALGVTPVEAPVADRDTFSVRWTDIEPHLTRRTKAVVLCTPSNPTGAIVDPREGALIVGELARRGVAVISDETYMFFVHEGAGWSAASAPAWRDSVVVIGSFSKSFGMMGWRVGYMLGGCERVRAGRQDSGRDDHLRAGHLANGRRGCRAQELVICRVLSRRLSRAAPNDGGRARANPGTPVVADSRRNLRVRAGRGLHGFNFIGD